MLFFVLGENMLCTTLILSSLTRIVQSCPLLTYPDCPELCVAQIIDVAELWDIPEDEVGNMYFLHHKARGIDLDPHGQYVLLHHLEFPLDHDKPDPVTYPHIPSSLQEVEIRNTMQWIEASYVKAIAFVFQIDQVNRCLFSCAGISNTFYVRYRSDIKTLQCLTPVTKGFDPFFSHFGCESYSKRIWNAIMDVSFNVDTTFTTFESIHWVNRIRF
jgi:hypothetical protein